MRNHILTVAALLSAAHALPAQMLLSDYIGTRMTAILEKRYPLKKDTQTSAITVSQGSTSLVDQTAGADLLNMATSFGFGGGNSSGNSDQTQAGVANASLYALVTYLQRLDPMDPSVYKTGKDLRRLSISIGQEAGVADKPDFKSRATVVGFRALLINKRDALDLANDPEVNNLKQAMATLGGANSRLFRDVVTYIISHSATPAPTPVDVANNGGTIAAGLSAADRAEIDSMIEKTASTVAQVRAVADRVYNKLRRKPQLSVEYQTSQRPGNEVDIHRGQLVFDVGVRDRVFISLNGGFEYNDFKRTGADLRGGRAAVEFKFNLMESSALGSLPPPSFSIAGESKWLNNSLNVYRGQAKLLIPITKGVNLPISFGYSSRPELLTESGVYGKFGLEFDFAKLALALQR